MKPFSYVAVTSKGQAIEEAARDPSAAFLAGGTGLVDLLKLYVQTPERLVDVHKLPLNTIEEAGDGALRVGAMVTNTDLAYDARIRERYPVLSQALLSGASPQLRNMATVGGNLMQRTRCPYFRDVTARCNKREPGSGCDAIAGYNRMHALLGTSDKCIATHPSDMCTALAALAPTIVVAGSQGERRIAFDAFYIAYGADPARETVLAHDELITAVELPPLPFARTSMYIKARDRASYEFALASAAVALNIEAHTITDARIALGGIATKPWRSHDAETVLVGTSPAPAAFARAADAALADAAAQTFNGFKIELAKRTLVRALTETAARTTA